MLCLVEAVAKRVKMAFQLLRQYHDFQFLKEYLPSLNNFYLIICRQVLLRQAVY